MITILSNIANGVVKGIAYMFYGFVISSRDEQTKKHDKMKKQLNDYLKYMNKKN